MFKMKNINVLVLSCLVFLFSCNRDMEFVKVTDDEGNLLEKFSINKETQQKDGVYYRYFPNKSLEEVANYKNDVLDGQRVLFFKNGDTMTIETYKNDLFEGIYKTFHKNKTIESIGMYVNNQISGIWKFYYDNGQLKEQVTFSNNNENGPFIEYYKNGNLKAKGNYKTNKINEDTDQKEHGIIEMYDEHGDLEKKMECNFGRCKTIWTRE